MDPSLSSQLVDFKPENPSAPTEAAGPPWKVLITDDDPSIHTLTRSILADYVFRKRGVHLFHARTGSEAIATLMNNPDTAAIFLDISLEKQNTGLNLIRQIRHDLGNHITQIIICTGHPDQAPEQKIIEAYEINDYRTKTELTAQKWHTILTSSLRAFQIKQDLQKELDEKEKLARELQESEKRFRDIAMTIGDWLWETDPDGYYTYTSGALYSEARLCFSRFKDRHFTELLTHDRNTQALIQITEATASHKPFSNIEIWRTGENGDLSCFLTSAHPLFDDHETFLGYRGVDKDITELRKTEREKEALLAQLRQAQRLEAIGTLAGGIAHDFNNILGAILGYTQILQLDIKSDEKQAHYTRQIIHGCNRAKNLILQILEFSRQRPQGTAVTPVSPSTIIKEALKLLRASIPSSIVIETDISSDAGYILADPSQVHHVIMNLCTNAYQAMTGDTGTIHVTVKKIHIHPHDLLHPKDLIPGDHVMIRVRDNGRGIQTDALEKIFEPYFSTRRGGDGTGLGLSVVHGIVTQAGGQISVTSTIGEGTEFTVYFPHHERHSLEETAVPAAPFPPKDVVKILFVDDERMLVDLGQSMLNRLGYTVTAVDSAKAALDIVAADPEKYDLIITDMTMPEMLGTQLAAKVKELRQDLPVILVTGLSSISNADGANPDVIDAFLTKPLSMNALAEAIKQNIVH